MIIRRERSQIVHSAVEKLHVTFLFEFHPVWNHPFPFSLHLQIQCGRGRSRRLSVFLQFPLACAWYLCRNIGSRNFIIRGNVITKLQRV